MVLGTVAYFLFLAFHFFLSFFTGPICKTKKKQQKQMMKSKNSAVPHSFFYAAKLSTANSPEILHYSKLKLISNFSFSTFVHSLCCCYSSPIRLSNNFFSRSFWKIVEKRQRNIFHFWMSCYFIFLFICSNALIFIYFIILKIHWECNAQCTVNKIWFVRLFFHCFPEEKERSNLYIPIRLLILCVCVYLRSMCFSRFFVVSLLNSFHLRFSPLLG